VTLTKVIVYRANRLAELTRLLTHTDSQKWEYLIISGGKEVGYTFRFDNVSTIYEIDIEQKVADSIQNFLPEINLLGNLKGLAFFGFASLTFPPEIGKLENLVPQQVKDVG
jgi:hypothetical protein